MDTVAVDRLQLQQLLFEQSPDAMALFGADGRVLLWNAGAEALYGYPAEVAIGSLWDELVVPPGANGEEESRRRRARDGGVTARAVLRRRQDGALVHADSALRAVFGPDGSLRAYAVSERDITALTIARDTRLLEERYRDLLESVPDAIVIANDIGRIVLFNGQAESMFGCTRAQLIGEPIETLLPSRFGATHVAHRLRFRARPQVRQMGAGLELYGRRHDGREFPVEISLSPLDVGDGHYVMSAIRDTSRQRQFEQALQDKNIELTVANQAKDRFLSTMSHELRTPLNAILGFSGLLLMQQAGALSGEQRHQLAIVRQSGEQLLALIEQLLALAQLQSGAPQLAPEPLDLAALLPLLQASLAPLADHAGRRLVLELPAGPVVLVADRHALQQLLRTLVLQALRERGGDLRLALRQTAGGVELCIGETVAAVPETDLPCTTNAQDGAGLAIELAGRLASVTGARLTCARAGSDARFTLRWENAA
ncbi:hypothetical protein CKO44_05600 [Rubrivivax gelatinosus]|uniref:histidine kinase n=1 Tax=Rubrivivax gelatinosus TaxID=28068 RepID=A0ABS1DW01_RUBGE|nr:PAS domain S-box protein [Rubrivivax gelatinosus]MBK1612945.1 hypothetical protein [Rubrivivax gelatinosus]MBK1713554.1 hypothetical protein [Rubrivivax gelatinosus]